MSHQFRTRHLSHHRRELQYTPLESISILTIEVLNCNSSSIQALFRGCSLACLRFLLRDALLCNSIRRYQANVGYLWRIRGLQEGAFQVTVTSLFIGNLVFRVPFLFTGLFSLGTYRYPCYLYNPDHVFGEWFLSS